jgi:hypothetical protein
LEFEGYGLHGTVLQNLLKSRTKHKREKLSILLRNGIKINLVDVLERLNQRYRDKPGVAVETARQSREERDDLERLVRDELERRQQRKQLLLAEIQIFLSISDLADIVAEYRGHVDIKTAQDLQEERELAKQQLEQEQKQQEQLQQKSKQAEKIIWV